MSSSTTLSSAGVGVESSAAGFPITYQCDSVIEKNPNTEDVEVSYYYELQFLSSVGAAFALEEFESNLLTLVSTSYGYDTGTVCTNIAEQGIWLVRVSSLPKDEENRLIDACVDLTANATHSCVSYQGHMSGSVIGPKDTSGFNDIIRGHIESGAVTAGTSMNAAFVDFIIEADQTNSGADNLPPAINIPEPVQDDFRRSRTITPIGGMLVVGLALGVIGIVLVLIQMRRRRSQMLHEEVIMATRSHDLTMGDFSNGKDDPDSPRDVTSTYMDEGYGDTGPLASPPAHFENQYTFDVGNLMKSELMGRHNNSQHPSFGSSVNRRELSGRGLDESDFSESDVDSWAQTDATLGSIEHRLEPITAEV